MPFLCVEQTQLLMLLPYDDPSHVHSLIHNKNKKKKTQKKQRCHIHQSFRKTTFLSFLMEKTGLPLSKGFDLNIANISIYSDPHKVTYSLVALNGTLSSEEALLQSYTLFPWQQGIISFTFLFFSFTSPHLL